MRTTTARFVAALVLATIGTPVGLSNLALPEMSGALGSYRLARHLIDIHDVNGPYRNVGDGELPPSVERWRPLVTVHFPRDWADWGLRIIACESRGNPDAENRRSSAAGLFQFVRATWNRVAAETGAPSYAEGGPLEPYWNVRNAAWLLEHGGPSHWQCTARR